MKICSVIGARPQFIKSAPLSKKLSERNIEEIIIHTGQHYDKNMSGIFFQQLNIPKEKYNLNINQLSHGAMTGRMIESIEKILLTEKPDYVLVYGDTNSTLAAALAASKLHIKIIHVEAGLRTGNILSPWPEEANRMLTSVLTSYHLAPTESSKNNLISENIDVAKICVTGNTVVDALFMALEKINNNQDLLNQFEETFNFLDDHKKLILVTGHRRESFGTGFENICIALKEVAVKNPQIQILYPVHLNPNVREPVNKHLNNQDNIFLIEPLEYLSFVYLMNKSYLILTDSGGIQEEAPSIGKPVLVMRETTERPEAVNAGTVKLVGTDSNTIIESVEGLINSKDLYDKMSTANNPYGDGFASQKILNFIKINYK